MDQSEYERTQNELIHSVLKSSYVVQFDEENEKTEIDPALQEQYLIDEEDKDILMHRDAHFGGSFPAMLDYYVNAKKGSVLDVSLKRIKYLQECEEKLQKNLSPMLLSGPDAEQVKASKKMYSDLRAVLDNAKDPNSLAVQIAELILSENEDLEADAQHIAQFGKAAAPFLIEIVDSQVLRENLFPGFGFAPAISALALGYLKADEALESLYLLMKQNPDEYELFVLKAFKDMGPKAQDFLTRILRSRPINYTNAQAAFALLQFQENDPDNEIANLFFEELQKKEVQQTKEASLALYLIAGCEDLPIDRRKDFIELMKTGTFSPEAKEELNFLFKRWAKNSP